MENDDRVSGIDIIGCIPWSTHFGLFYKSKQDLIDVLVPYFKAGLENNEFCMWVTAEPLGVDEARTQMRRAMPDFDSYIEKGQIEIIPHTEWYTIDGVFDADRVLNGWVYKLREAGRKGFSGLRLTGNESWLDRSVWRDFIDYERMVNDIVGQYKMIIVCTYSLEMCDTDDILDVANTHQFALVRRGDEWKRIENVGLKETREALEASEFRYRSLFEHMVDGFAHCKMIFDEQDRPVDFVYLAVNEAFGRLTGLENVVGKRITEVLPGVEEQHPELFEIYGRVARTGNPERFEIDFKPLSSWLSIAVYSTERGLFTAIFENITQRKQAEEALKKSEASLIKIIDTSPIPMVVYREEKIYRINKKFVETFGYSVEDIPSIDEWWPLAYPDKAYREFVKNRWYTAVDNAVKNKTSIVPQEAVVTCKDGSKKEVLGFFSSIGDMNLAILQDITEHKQADEDLKAAKAQAELYVDLMGHDINNIHQTALGYLELARDMPCDTLDECLDKATEALHRSTRLINNVRKLQTFQDNRVKAHDVDVCVILAGVHDEFVTTPDKTIMLNLNGFTHCHVRADDLLYDVFSNLVGNAVKHTGDQAYVSINLDTVIEGGMEYCCVRVEDDGPGIPEESKKTLFNRSLKGTPRAKGMGLGLYIVKILVENYGGRVWAEDRIQGNHTKGARFVVILPLVHQ